MANLVYPNFFVASAKKLINFNTDVLKLVLCNGDSPDNTDTSYTDLNGELSTGFGYTEGGIPVTSSVVSATAGVVTYDISDIPIAAVAGDIGPFTHGFLYDFTADNKDLIYAFDFDGATSIVDGTTFTIEIDVDGLFTIS